MRLNDGARLVVDRGAVEVEIHHALGEQVGARAGTNGRTTRAAGSAGAARLGARTSALAFLFVSSGTARETQSRHGQSDP